MQLSEALARTHITRLTEFTCLADVLEPELIQSCLDSQGVATLRRRKLPMDAMIWAVIGMALFRGESIRSLINKLDIVLPQEIDYVTHSAVTQERWGVLLAYNLIRYKMLLMAKSLPSVHPNQLSFRDAASYIIFKLTQLPSQTLGNIPRDVLDVERNARQFKLNGKRERTYPRVLKMSKNKFPVRPKKMPFTLK